MRAVVLESYGEPEVLTIRDVPDPRPGPEEVVVDIVATALNRADLLQRRGFYPGPPMAHEIPGMELSGVVRQVGERVTLWSPGDEGSNGSVRLARELAADDPTVYMPFQYANQANPDAHYRTTGPEILEDLDGRVDAFVAGLGTGGTLMGTGRALREARPDVQIIAAEPLQGDPVMGLRSLDDGYTPEILDITQLDRKILVSNGEAVRGLRALLDQEGLWVGVSAGAVLAVGRRVAADLDPDQNVVMLFADGGWKYASAGLWDRPEDELEEEMESKLWW